MHPIVIIASDKDPAIGAAVDGLQAAGFEVRVLNTATAKLVDFLGALAGADDEEEEKKVDAPEDAPEDEVKEPKPPKDDAPPAEEAPADEVDPEAELSDDPLDPKKMEAKISGEPVLVEIVEGMDLVLHPSTIVAGAKTFYTLNESQFSFWPTAVSNEPITGGVELELDGQDVGHLTKVIFSEEVASPPVLKIGRGWLEQRKITC